MTGTQAPTITLRDLTLGYERHPAVHHLSLQIDPGALVAVVGPNGAGKSSLIKALAGVLAPLSGHIEGLRLQSLEGFFAIGHQHTAVAHVAQHAGRDTEVDGVVVCNQHAEGF